MRGQRCPPLRQRADREQKEAAKHGSGKGDQKINIESRLDEDVHGIEISVNDIGAGINVLVPEHCAGGRDLRAYVSASLALPTDPAWPFHVHNAQRRTDACPRDCRPHGDSYG